MLDGGGTNLLEWYHHLDEGATEMSKITLTNTHGTFTTSGMGLDREIENRLPASPNSLRYDYAGAANAHEDYSDVVDVAAFLIMFADMEYPSQR